MKSLEHDFKNYPELTNRQMDLFYLESPHKQIGEDFWAKVVKVIDGDTIRVTMDERDFDFPVRFLGIAAPEKNESGGIVSLKWLSNEILGEEVLIQIDKKERVGKWGRLLGTIIHKGMNINEESIRNGMSIPFDQIEESGIPNFLEKLEVIK